MLDPFLALIHSSPPDTLARMLNEILQNLETHGDRLIVFVPEVCSMLGQCIITRDLDALSALAEALHQVLSEFDVDPGSSGYVGMRGDAASALRVSYYLGRLQGLLALASQVPVVDIPPYVLVEALDDGDNEAILRLVAELGPMSIRTLRDAFNSLYEGPPRRYVDLRKCLTRLVRVGAIEAVAGPKHGLIYALSPLGRKLLDESPQGWQR